MSLINKMLQDLETRNNPQAEAANKKPVYEDLKPLSRVPAPHASSRRLPVMLLATVVVFGSGAYAWTQWGDGLVASLSSDKVVSKPTPVVARKAAAPKPKPKPAPVPALAPVAVATVAQTEVVTPPASSAPVEKPVEAPAQLAQAPAVMPAGSKTKTAKETGYWTVSRGETLYGISVQTGVDLLALSRWNNLGREHVIHPGQRLRLTSPAKETAAVAPAMTSSVQKSEPKPAPAMTSSAGAGQGTDAVMDKRVKRFSPNEKAESEYHRAADLLQKGRMADAGKHLRLALGIDAAHTPSRELLAGLMLQQGHWREAQELLEQGIHAVPAHYPFAQLLARVHVEHGADHKALVVMEGSHRAGAENPEYVAFLAALYQRAGKHVEAVKTYSEAVTLNPQEGRWWLGMGISLEAVQDRDAAGAAYQRAINSGVLDDRLLQYARQRLAIVKK